MIIDVILGNNIDTPMWIKDLKEIKADHIIVIDYDYREAIKEINGVNFMSPTSGKEYIKKFDAVNYYKSMYLYPGMQKYMSSLYEKD